MAASLLPTAIALPDHVHSQREIGEAVSLWLRDFPDKAARARSVLAHANVERRYTVRPVAWYLEHTSVTERSEVYREEMIALCSRAAQGALDGAGLSPQAIGLIISVSATGFMIPSVESHLMNRMPFSPHTRRMPLTELGCAGGAAAVAHANTYLKAHPQSAALIVACELPSLTAQVSDFTMANIVSASLFGDGAAGTVVAGEKFVWDGAAGPEQRPAPRILATRGVLFPGSEELMGFDNTDGGFKIVLAPRLPRFAQKHLPGPLREFLASQGLGLEDVTHFLLHPGGPKVIEGLERAFGLSREQTRFSHEVLRDYGNLSSATVLFVAHLFEREARPRPGEYGLMLALGPGFCAEMVLLQW